MTRYKVVTHGPRCFAVWPEHRDTQDGWRETGTRGTLLECLAAVRRAWFDTDRPTDAAGPTRIGEYSHATDAHVHVSG